MFNSPSVLLFSNPYVANASTNLCELCCCPFHISFHTIWLSSNYFFSNLWFGKHWHSDSKLIYYDFRATDVQYEPKLHPSSTYQWPCKGSHKSLHSSRFVTFNCQLYYILLYHTILYYIIQYYTIKRQKNCDIWSRTGSKSFLLRFFAGFRWSGSEFDLEIGRPARNGAGASLFCKNRKVLNWMSCNVEKE